MSIGSRTPDYMEVLDREGFVRIPSVVPKCARDGVEHEYHNLLGRRLEAWKEETGFDPGVLKGTSFAQQLVAVACAPGFNTAWLDDFEIGPPHRPFSVLSGCRPFYIGDRLLDMMMGRELKEVIQPIVGTEISVSPNQHNRLKLPLRAIRALSNGGHHQLESTMWHQDALTQWADADDVPLVTCWIPMMDVGREQGCLRIVPGMHAERRVLPIPADRELVARLEEESVDVEAEAGDIILLDKFAPHASRPNMSNKLRWSFDLRYGPTGAPSDRPWFPSCALHSAKAMLVPSAASWTVRWQAAVEDIVSRREPLPGRREFSMLMAERYVRNWEKGGFPTAK